MKELDEEIWKLISRYLSGKSSAAEQDALRKWMSRDPLNRQIVDDLEQIWVEVPEEDFEVDAQEAWVRFKEKKLSGKNKQHDTPRYYQNKKGRYTFLKVAAVFVLVAITAFASWQYFGAGYGESAMQEYSTKKGERAEIELPDGSKVTMNVASSLRYPKEFSNSNREVYLDGEAYFEVTSNPGKPFIIHTEDVRVEVLGTKFNVQAWKEDGEAKIGVHEGKVSVIGSAERKKSAVLERGQLATVINGRTPVVQQVNMDQFLLWMNGGMYFDRVPFETAVRQIERKFGVQISIKSPALKSVPFTGTFRKAELTEVLNLVAASMGISYSREGNMILFAK